MVNLTFGNLTIPPARSVNGAAAGTADRQLAVAGSRTVVPLTYGEDRLGARILNVLPAASGSTTLLVQCLWGFAGDGVLDVRLNDQALPAGATVTSYTGGQATADAALVSAFAAQGITYSDTLNGYQYSVVALPMRSVEGSLSISARIRGRRLYDPRKDSTVPGGAGVHRLNNPATWEWSDCPALADADFLASSTYGCGRTVNWVSVIAAADANDLLVGAPQEKRRVIGVSFISPAPVAQIADALRAYAGCWHVPGGQGIRLVPDVDSAPVATFSHDAGGILAMDPLTLRDIGDAPTAVEVLYTDTRAIPWREGSATASVAGAGTSLPWRLSQVRLPGIQRYSQALREATERLNKLTLQGITTGVDVFDDGIAIEEGDVVALTHPVGLTARPFRVVAPAMVGPGRWRLTVVEHSASAYSTSVVAPPSLVAPALANPVGAPGAVAGLAGTVGQGIITWTWTEPLEQDAQVRLRQGGTDWASAAPVWSGRATTFLQRVTAAGSYTLRARAAVPDGLGGWVESASTASVTINVVAGDLVQSEPGSPGLSQAMAELYQWGSSSQPGNPSGTSVWTWSTAGHASYSGGNGWSTTIGANPGTAGSRLWVARKPVSAAVGTAATNVDWTGGFTIFAAGVNGAQGPIGNTGSAGSPGIKAATPTVWRWAASVPTIAGTATYTWAAADVGLVPSGWSATPGTGSPGQTLYGASVQLVDAAGAATTTIDWSTASISARGYQGTNGGTGPQGVAGVSARRAYVLTGATSLGSGTVVTTGSSSLPPDGSFGANGWQAQPGTPTVGQTLYQSDGLYDPVTNQVTWSTPYISALKVGNLAALAVNTGNLTVDGSLVVGAGGGAFSSNYVPGTSGWALLPTGAQLPAASILGTLVIGQVPTSARNSELAIAADGRLLSSGVAQGQATLTGMGLSVFRVVAAGGSAVNVPAAGGLYRDGVLFSGAFRSYTLNVISRATGQVVLSSAYDVMTNPSQAGALAAALNATGPDAIVVVRSWDDARDNRLTNGLEAAMYRCGASRVVFGSPRVRFASAYVLIGIPGCGEGNGAEFYQGAIDNDPNAWIDAVFQVQGGQLTGVSAGYTPSSLQDYGYVGDLDATRGAPAGTLVGSTSAVTVEAGAASGGAAWSAINDATTGLGARLRSNARNVLAGGAGIAVGSLTWDSAGVRISGHGVGITAQGIAAFNPSGQSTFALDAATGDAVFGGQLTAAFGSIGALVIASGGHVRSGQTGFDTGSGFWLGLDGGVPKFSLGGPGKALTWDGAQLRITGDAVLRQNITAAANNYGTYSGTAVSTVTATHAFGAITTTGFVVTTGVAGTVEVFLNTSAQRALRVYARLVAVSGATTVEGPDVELTGGASAGLLHATTGAHFIYAVPVCMTWAFTGSYWSSRKAQRPGQAGIPGSPTLVQNFLTAGAWTLSLQITVEAFAASSATPSAVIEHVRSSVSGWALEIQGSQRLDPVSPIL